jgi:hypothetical protein
LIFNRPLFGKEGLGGGGEIELLNLSLYPVVYKSIATCSMHFAKALHDAIRCFG